MVSKIILIFIALAALLYMLDKLKVNNPVDVSPITELSKNLIPQRRINFDTMPRFKFFNISVASSAAGGATNTLAPAFPFSWTPPVDILITKICFSAVKQSDHSRQNGFVTLQIQANSAFNLLPSGAVLATWTSSSNTVNINFNASESIIDLSGSEIYIPKQSGGAAFLGVQATAEGSFVLADVCNFNISIMYADLKN